MKGGNTKKMFTHSRKETLRAINLAKRIGTKRVIKILLEFDEQAYKYRKASDKLAWYYNYINRKA